MLSPLGLEKGKPFAPAEREKKLLADGALIGELMSMNISYAKRFPNSYYRDDAKWAYVVLLDPKQETPNLLRNSMSAPITSTRRSPWLQGWSARRRAWAQRTSAPTRTRTTGGSTAARPTACTCRQTLRPKTSGR